MGFQMEPRFFASFGNCLAIFSALLLVAASILSFWGKEEIFWTQILALLKLKWMFFLFLMEILMVNWKGGEDFHHNQVWNLFHKGEGAAVLEPKLDSIPDCSQWKKIIIFRSFFSKRKWPGVHLRVLDGFRFSWRPLKGWRSTKVWDSCLLQFS